MKKIFIYVFLLAAVCLVSFSAGEFYAGERNAETEEKATNVSGETAALSVKDGEDLTDVIERVLPSVVGISARGGESVNLGSGVILSEMGYIITNQHVTGDKPGKIDVTLSDGSVRSGKLVWSDKALDIAAVKIEGDIPACAKMGDEKTVKAGEDVIAIGNPLSLQFERSVTKGIVSATGRTITVNSDGQSMYMEDLIQTDASINPGNSGGPLINSSGEVIGINTIRVADAEGMGFAVPVGICEGVISALERTGEFETPYLGLYAYTSQTAKYLKKKEVETDGLFVISLDRKGPAYAAGVRYGDVIVSADGKSVKTMIELRKILFAAGCGRDVTLSLKSGGGEKAITVTLGKMDYSYAGENQ